jgi:hypothetical protein
LLSQVLASARVEQLRWSKTIIGSMTKAQLFHGRTKIDNNDFFHSIIPLSGAIICSVKVGAGQ